MLSDRIKKMHEGKLSKEDKQAIFDKSISKIDNKLQNFYKRVPKVFRNMFVKNYFNKTSKTMAIKGKCLDCSNFDREEITNCHMRQCALWNFRPYRPKK